MSEFHLSHIALVGARMSTFQEYGYSTRNDLLMHKVVPGEAPATMESLPIEEVRKKLINQFPLWVHNIIVDPEFPQRDRLLMPLRRFEGELADSRNNMVISAVLSAGFKNRTLDPLDLPESMLLRERCALVSQSGIWQEAFFRLENDILDIMVEHLPEIAKWIQYAAQSGHELVEYNESA